MSAERQPEVTPGLAADLAAGEQKLMPLAALRGLDSAIIHGFLALSPQRRSQVIAAYSAQHGEAAGAWLKRAQPLWSQQRLGVSRVVLARLFALLPQTMDQAERLELAKSIWHVARAPTQAILSVPTGFRHHALLSELVHEHFMSVLPSVLELPEVLQQNLPWLQDPAMQAQQDVLNLLLLAERDQLLQLADEQIAVLFARRVEGMEIRSELNIVGHQLLIRTNVDAPEPSLRLRNQGIQKTLSTYDGRAPRSAFLGTAIGAGLAIMGWLLYLWLS